MAAFPVPFPQPPPSNPRYTPPTPQARRPRRDAPPPRRLRPICFDSSSTEDGKVLTPSTSFNDEDSSDYEHEGSSHAWFATTSQPSTPRAALTFAEGPSSFGPVSSDQFGQGALMEEDEDAEEQPRPLSIASAWERELIDEYMEE